MAQFNLDFNKLNQETEKLKTGDGGSRWMSQGQVEANSEIYIRIMPPIPSLNGIPYFKMYSVWMNGKNYISPRTFGEACPILDFVDEAVKQGNEDIIALTKDWKKYSSPIEYIFPILKLDPITEGGRRVGYDVEDDMVKFFKVKVTSAKAISKVITHPEFQNDTDLGVMDRVEGHNIIFSKEVTKGDGRDTTTYAAMGQPKASEMDEKYYIDVPDVVGAVKNLVYTDEYLEKVCASYFYGEAFPPDDLRKKRWTGSSSSDEDQPKAEKKKSTPKATRKQAPKVEKKAEPKVTPKKDVAKGLSVMERLKQMQK